MAPDPNTGTSGLSASGASARGVGPVSVQLVPRLAAEVIRHKARNIRRAGETHQVGDAGADGGSAETLRLRDHPRGHEPAIAPAHHAEMIRIRDAQVDDVVHA